MSDLVGSILIGILLIVVVFFIFFRLLRMGGKLSATMVAMMVLGIYVPLSIFRWPGGDVFAIHMAMYMVTAYLLGIITSYREKRLAEFPEGEKPRFFHWGPAVIVGFFLFLIVVDGIFVTWATKGMSSDVAAWLLPKPSTGHRVESHFPGTVSKDYQKAQSEYNAYLAQLETQKKRGWNIRKGFVNTPHVGEDQVFQLELRDKQGKLLSGAEINGRFMRPSNSKLDIPFEMKEVSPGLYQSHLSLAYPGNWDLDMHIRRGEEKHLLQGSTYVEAAR
jgi:nitrogen fixation protein FixH